MFQKSIVTVLLILSSTSVLAAPNLPFVGKRDFNFMGGNGTGLTIQINNNGRTIIKSCGVSSCTIDYKGAYKQLIPDGSGGYYRFTSNKVYQLDSDGKMTYGCSGEDSQPCVSDLYKQ